MRKVAVVFGTRPEAIKMAPVIVALKNAADIETQICTTGQHREMLNQVLHGFEITPSVVLDVMEPEQSLSTLTIRLISKIDTFFAEFVPDLVLVQGDTTTAFCAALTAFYHRIPLAHVEAGLRTGNLQAPWPEEANRVLISRLAALHFAPTERAKHNLITEGVRSDAVFLTGNTVVDALLLAAKKVDELRPNVFGVREEILSGRFPLVLITCHRRESFGMRLERICTAIAQLSERFPHVHFVYPVHLNPNVRRTVLKILASHTARGNVHLIEPLTYFPFVRLLSAATFVLTDSGGIQEEAPGLGKPVLVMRDTTERPEAIEAGVARLVGTEVDNIVRHATKLLSDPDLRKAMVCVSNPFGDGSAAERIVCHCRKFLRLDP